MSEKITLCEFAKTSEYRHMAETTSKSFIFFFTVFCLYYGFCSNYEIGILWIAIWLIGIFVSSLVFATLSNTIRVWILLQMVNHNISENRASPICLALNLVDLTSLALLFLALGWFLEIVSL